MEDDVRWLENGMRWLDANEQHPRHAEMEAAWLERLAWYEQAYRMVVNRDYS